MVTRKEKLCFEAGIKMGGLYHQFIGTPIRKKGTRKLEKAIEESIESQRFVDHIDVKIDCVEHNRFGYTEIEGTMLNVDLKVKEKETEVKVSMSEEDGYPMMRIEEIEDGRP